MPDFCSEIMASDRLTELSPMAKRWACCCASACILFTCSSEDLSADEKSTVPAALGAPASGTAFPAGFAWAAAARSWATMASMRLVSIAPMLIRFLPSGFPRSHLSPPAASP